MKSSGPPKRKFLFILFCTLMFPTFVLSDDTMTQEELAAWIYELSNWEVDVHAALDLQLAGFISETASFLRIEDCEVTIQGFRVLEDGYRLLDSTVMFDLTGADILPGRGAVFPPTGQEPRQFYSYFKQDFGPAAGTFISGVSFINLDSKKFYLLKRDYMPVLRDPNVEAESLSMRESQIEIASFSYNFPINEAQIQDLSNAIIEYKKRFCTLIG